MVFDQVIAEMKKWNDNVERMEGSAGERDEKEREHEKWRVRLERLEGIVRERMRAESEGVTRLKVFEPKVFEPKVFETKGI